MSVTPKTPEELAGMRVAGRLAAEVLEMIEPQIEVGMTTGEIDRICHDYIVNVQNAIPAPLNYHGFPKSICTSINDVICHGIPSDSKKLRNGDIINIDVTVIKDGWHGDTSIMVGVGDVAPHAERLMRITQECLYKALAIVRPGTTLGISAMSSSSMRKKITTRWSGSTAVTASGEFFTKSPRSCTTGHRAGAKSCRKA